MERLNPIKTLLQLAAALLVLLSGATVAVTCGCTAPQAASPASAEFRRHEDADFCDDLVAIVCEKVSHCVEGMFTADQCFSQSIGMCAHTKGIDENEYRACGWAVLQQDCPPIGQDFPTPDACFGIADDGRVNAGNADRPTRTPSPT